MSFEPFKFTYTPPETVAPAPLVAPTPESVSTATSASTAGSTSKAAQLASQLDDLTEMSKYLQDAIVARTKNTAIQIDPAIDPDTARALVSIYGSPEPPAYITVGMYNQILDAHYGALQLNMSVGNASAVTANPFEIADLTQVVNTLNKHLTNNPSYNNWLPLMLGKLKGDAIVFQSWKTALNKYPATKGKNTPLAPETYTPAPISASNLDISSDLGSYESTVIQHFNQSYSNTYLAMATPSPVDSDISNVLNTFLDQSLGDMLRISACLNTLVSVNHKASMADSVGDVNNYSFVQLASDASGMLHNLDMLSSMASSPIKSGLGSISGIVTAVQNAANSAGRPTTGPLAGLSATSPCVQNNPSYSVPSSGTPAAPITIPGLGDLTSGLQSLGETLDWALNTTNSTTSAVARSFSQVVERRAKGGDDLNSLMCSIKTIGSLIASATSVISAYKNGTTTPATSAPTKQSTVNSILTSLQTGSGTTFTTSGNQVVVNPPDMPPVSAPVQRVLSSAKIQSTRRPIST